jgi:hypothetical protein
VRAGLGVPADACRAGRAGLRRGTAAPDWACRPIGAAKREGEQWAAVPAANLHIPAPGTVCDTACEWELADIEWRAVIQRFLGVSIGALVTLVIIVLSDLTNQTELMPSYVAAAVIGAIASFFWPVVAGIWLGRRAEDRRDEQIQKEVDRRMAEQQKRGLGSPSRAGPRAPARADPIL